MPELTDADRQRLAEIAAREKAATAGPWLVGLTKEKGEFFAQQAEQLSLMLDERDREIFRLQGILDGLADRVAAQSELLRKRAEKETP